jgi:hypothetical protein
MEEVHDEALFADRVAGLDIAKAGVDVTVRVPGATAAGRRRQETRSYGTTRRELESLGDWLASWGVTRAGMEATGDYWKPVFFVLEARGFDCQLYHAGQVKALPGRPKTGPTRCGWPRSPSGGRSGPASSRPSRSAGCALPPATAAT